MLTLDKIYQAAFALKGVSGRTDLIVAEDVSEDGEM